MIAARTEAPSLEERYAVEAFLFHEARLLDEHRLREWLELFTPDGLYWVPLVPGQTDHVNHASLFCEGALLREMRVKRLESVRAFSQQPATRTSHLVGNVTVESAAPDGQLVVRSVAHILEWRKFEQRAFGATVEHRLVKAESSFRIICKRVDLINCDAQLEGLQVFL